VTAVKEKVMAEESNRKNISALPHEYG